MTILEPLQDAQLSEGQDAHFQCRLSRALGQEAHWALGGVPLQANEMNDITVEHGTLHLLTLHKVVFPRPPVPCSASRGLPTCSPKSWERGKVPTPVQLGWGLAKSGWLKWQCQPDTCISVPSGHPRGCWNHQFPSGLMSLGGPAEGHRWAAPPTASLPTCACPRVPTRGTVGRC